MKTDYKQKLLNCPVKRQSLATRAIFHCWLGSKCRKHRVQYTYEFDKKSIKNKQILFLSTHASRNDFFYALHGLGRSDIHIVAGYQNFFTNRTNYFGMTAMNAIPKLLYQPDTYCTRKMLRVLKNGRSLALFPEGIQSLSGSTHPINPATCKFIKRGGVTVVLATATGSYLTNPRYIREIKRGKITVNYKILFTPEQLKEMSEEQIYKVLLQNFAYNDFQAQKTIRAKFVGKHPNVAGVDNVLFVCPQCKGVHTLKVHLEKGHERLECEQCGYAVNVNEYYDLVDLGSKRYFDDIDQWVKWERRFVRKQVQNEDFQLKGHGKITQVRTDSWKKYPKNRLTLIEGDVTLDKSGLTVKNEKSEMFFGVQGLYSLTMATGRFLEFYYQENYYNLVLDGPTNQLVQWMLASEELHNLTDEKWNAASNDAFDYAKEGEM